MSDQVEITLKKSWISTTPNQKENLKGLGLFRREATVLRPDTASTRGMIMKVIHLVDVRHPGAAAKKTFSGPWVEITPPTEEPVEAESKTKLKAKAKAAKLEAGAKAAPVKAPAKAAKAAGSKKKKKEKKQ
jgi:large subunit ribosomal protein L30